MKCKNCENEAVKYGKYVNGDYCSRKCANTRHPSKETKEKIRESVSKNGNINNPSKETREKIRLGVIQSIENRRKSGLVNPRSKKPYKFHSREKVDFVCPYCQFEIKTLKYKWGNRKTCGKKECVSKCQSDIAKKQIETGIRVNRWGGRCKKFTYVDKNNNALQVDGNFELEFCKWCDRNSIDFKRNRIGFKYLFEGKEHSYFPDFAIQDSIFVETKGYETDKDKAKWSQFPYPLIVLRKKQVKLLKKDLMKSIGEIKQFMYNGPSATRSEAGVL